MSNWLDILSLIVSLALFVGIIAGALYAARAISNTIDETKKSLNEKGVNISASGISVKTGKHMTREDYLDATQRNVVKAIQTSTTSVVDSVEMAQQNGTQHRPPSIKRSSTSGSNRSVDSTKKRTGLFGIRKSASKLSNHST